MTPPIKENKYTYYLTYSENTGKESRSVIKDTLKNLAERARKNKHIFGNLRVNICNDKDDLVVKTPFSSTCKDLDDFDDAMGMSVMPFANNDIKEIIIRTKDNSTGFLGFFCDEHSDATLRGVALHEFGHLFDFYFGEQDTEALQFYKTLKSDSIEADVLLNKVLHSDGLRNSKEFKNAWREDANKIGKMSEEEQEKLGYIKPNFYSEIDISDGVDELELEIAEPDRGEAFAQLFSYALSPNKNIECYDKKSILNAYPKTMAVVKSYITKFFGISFNFVPLRKAKRD